VLADTRSLPTLTRNGDFAAEAPNSRNVAPDSRGNISRTGPGGFGSCHYGRTYDGFVGHAAQPHVQGG
jgi:hypothetical protein